MKKTQAGFRAILVGAVALCGIGAAFAEGRDAALLKPEGFYGAEASATGVVRIKPMQWLTAGMYLPDTALCVLSCTLRCEEGAKTTAELDVLIDNAIVATHTVSGRDWRTYTVSVPISEGMHELTLAYLQAGEGKPAVEIRAFYLLTPDGTAPGSWLTEAQFKSVRGGESVADVLSR